jgi:hypothetical protein
MMRTSSSSSSCNLLRVDDVVTSGRDILAVKEEEEVVDVEMNVSTESGQKDSNLTNITPRGAKG